MFRGLAFALVASVALSTSAFAGGSNGGTKKDATVKIVNDLTGPFVAIVNPSQALRNVVSAPTSEQQVVDAFNKEGGKVLEPGKEASFKVKAGNVTIYAVSVGPTIDVVRSVGKGKTLTVKLSSP